jgi:hypothetical protein
MPLEDNLITVSVRRVLTSSWVDITAVNIRTTRGVVYITGMLQRMTYQHADMYPKMLQHLDLTVRNLPGVRDVKYNLNNWEQNLHGAWLPVRTQDQAAGGAELAAAGTQPVTSPVATLPLASEVPSSS